FQGSPGRIEAYPLNGSRPDVDLPTSIEQPESIYGYNFGESLAAAGEWLIAGTPAGPYQFSPGKVYVYQQNPDSGDWTLAAMLQAPDGGTAGDRFGAAVATDGDWLFVGAPGTTVGGVDQRGA